MTAAPTPPPGPWLLAGDAATRARCGRREIIAALNDGSLRGYQRRAGGTWRIHVDDLDAWLRGQAPPVNVTSIGHSA